jgi:hypothetical protein
MKSSDFLIEYKISPSVLINKAYNISALVGIECEMCVPNVIEKSRKKDYSKDERCIDIYSIINFFSIGNYNSSYIIKHLEKTLTYDYDKWWDDKNEDDWYSYGKSEVIDNYEKNSDLPENELADEVDMLNDERGDTYKELKKDWLDNNTWYNKDRFENEWLENIGLRNMSDVKEEYDLEWVYYREDYDDNINFDKVSSSFQKVTGIVPTISQTYHGVERTNSRYIIEPDSSILCDSDKDAGLEFISPPISFSEMVIYLQKIFNWAKHYGCYTNESTGLHINVSLTNFNKANLDYLKLLLLLGDKYVLSQFNRLACRYCESSLDKLFYSLNKSNDFINHILNNFKKNFDDTARSLSKMYTAHNKYSSVNIKDNYIEFRSVGGNWLNYNIQFLESTMARFIVILDAACNPTKLKQLYLKKLYILLSPYMRSAEEKQYGKYLANYLSTRQNQADITTHLSQLINSKYRKQTAGQKLPLPQ